jgi:CheY-like chemotaxis protein
LVVEDHPQVQAHTAAMLRRLGYRVTTAADGHEALRILNQGLHPDLLFTDVLLRGGMNGVALARQARALRPDLPVLFTSGLADHAALREEGLMPWAVVLAKPFRAPDLARAVRGRIDAAKAGGESS